jgi:GST-like protein
MIDLYFWTTDNGYKARQALEETGFKHSIKPVNLREREQFAPAYLAISPGHKMPAIVDHDGPGGAKVTLCESGAILRYLGEKAGDPLYPSDPIERVKVDQWLFYGSATFTPIAQQYGFFVKRSPEDVPAAKLHFTNLMKDMIGVLNTHLANAEYVAGAYSVADISLYPDVHLHGVDGVGLAEFPNVQRWHDAIAKRPAVQHAWGPH